MSETQSSGRGAWVHRVARATALVDALDRVSEEALRGAFTGPGSDQAAAMNPGGAGLAGWEWVGCTNLSGAPGDVHVYRSRAGRPGEAEVWACVPLPWRERQGGQMRGLKDLCPFEQHSPITQAEILVTASALLWTAVGFEAFVEEALDRVERSVAPFLRASMARQARAILRIVDDPATEPVRLLAALRLG